jgi:hypothetical protein
MDVGYDDNRSTLVIVGKNDRTYYLVFEKMDKIQESSEIIRYTEADKLEYVERHGNMKITDKVYLRDIHQNSVSSTLVGIETASYKVTPHLTILRPTKTSTNQNQIWTWGRIACLGDSAHKMTPNAGKLVHDRFRHCT